MNSQQFIERVLEQARKGMNGEMDVIAEVPELGLTVRLQLKPEEYLSDTDMMGIFTDRPTTNAYCDRATGNILTAGEPVPAPPDGWEYEDSFTPRMLIERPALLQWRVDVRLGLRHEAVGYDEDSLEYEPNRTTYYEYLHESWATRKVKLSHGHIHDCDAPTELWYTTTGNYETDAAALLALDEYLLRLQSWVDRHTNAGELIAMTGGPRKCYDVYHQSKYFQPMNDLDEGYTAEYIMDDWKRAERIEDNDLTVAVVHATIKAGGLKLWERWYGGMDVDSYHLDEQERNDLESLINELLHEFVADLPDIINTQVADLQEKMGRLQHAAAEGWTTVG